MKTVYKRILLKISGEVLAGEAGHGIDFDTALGICKAVKEISRAGVQVGLVVGGGNFWRGRSSGKMDRSRADHMGMLATVMNATALEDTFEQIGVDAVAMSALPMEQFAETFVCSKAKKYLEEGKVVIFGCGTGNPFFTTDSGAALKAAEIEADILFKATNVDGVYDKDPNKFEDAVKFDTLTQAEILEKDLKVMDSTAAALCKDNNIPILVFNLNDPRNIIRAVEGQNIGTIVK
ncbi:MAG: UMP kinase [Clostridia bacterium]|nr:UMP kinase [Clostridia bacterium]